MPRCLPSCLLVLALLAVAPAFSRASESPRPNVVVILADDLGYGDLGCYGATNVSTPNMDRLAKEGMRFTDAHSPHSVCTPTRYSLLTGRYSWRTWAKHRCVWSSDPLLIEVDRPTLPRMMQAAGYTTACIGKWHLGFGAPGRPGWDDEKGPDYNRALVPGPLEVGFDHFFGIPHVGQYPHVYIEDHLIVGLEKSDPIRIVLDERLAGRTDFRERRTLTPWHTFEGGAAATYDHEELQIELTRRAVDWIDKRDDEPFFLYFTPRNVHSPLKPNERFRGTSEIGVYGDFVHELDWSIGELLAALDRKGLTKNTLVLLSSDNGAVQMGHRPAKIVDYNGHRANGPLRGQKTEAYEGGHRVPLLVRWPGHVQAGSTSDQLLALTDVYATLAELLGRELPAGASPDGTSFLPALLPGRADHPMRKTIVHDSNGGLFAVREGDWKLILGQGGGGLGWDADAKDANEPGVQLYNLAEDLDESNNLAEERPEIVARLRQLQTDVRRRGIPKKIP